MNLIIALVQSEFRQGMKLTWQELGYDLHRTKPLLLWVLEELTAACLSRLYVLLQFCILTFQSSQQWLHTLHLEGWHFMQNTFSTFFFFLNCLSIMAIDRARVGWIQSFNIFQTIYILQCKKLEFPCSFYSLSCLYWLLYFLLHATAKVQLKPELHICLDRQVCFTGSVAEGPLGVAGKGDYAVPWSSEEVSFPSRLLWWHAMRLLQVSSFSFLQNLDGLSKTGQEMLPSMHIAVMQYPKMPFHFAL